MCRIVQQLDKFFNKHYSKEGSVILGLSGGPDSTAMLYALHKLKNKHDLNLVVIHVDHGWREESAEEAAQLKKIVEMLEFPFRAYRLEPDGQSISNREERARDARLEIFYKVYQETNAQALVLAHHAQDLGETVLKRLFEGSGLFAWGGMKAISLINSMTVWRPFLSLPKQELVEFCKKNSLSFFFDKTNEDPRYLRTRIRKQIVPAIQEHFGKGIESNLAQFSEISHEVAGYFKEKSRQIVDSAENISGDMRWDLRSAHSLEAQFAIYEIAKDQGVVLGYQHVRHIMELIRDRVPKRSFSMAKRFFLIDKGFLVLKSSEK